jgi:hypothetical protein
VIATSASQFDLHDVIDPLGVRVLVAIVEHIATDSWPSKAPADTSLTGWTDTYLEACHAWLHAEHRKLPTKQRRSFRRIARNYGWNWNSTRKGSWAFLGNYGQVVARLTGFEWGGILGGPDTRRFSVQLPDMQNLPLPRSRWKPHDPVEIPDWLKRVDYAKLESRLARGIAYHKAFEKKLRRAEKRAVRRTRRLAKTIPLSTHTWGMAIDVDASKKGTPK